MSFYRKDAPILISAAIVQEFTILQNAKMPRWIDADIMLPVSTYIMAGSAVKTAQPLAQLPMIFLKFLIVNW